jgi:hypothetical protein
MPTPLISGLPKAGPFDLPGELARTWLKQPNPNGRPNSRSSNPGSTVSTSLVATATCGLSISARRCRGSRSLLLRAAICLRQATCSAGARNRWQARSGDQRNVVAVSMVCGQSCARQSRGCHVSWYAGSRQTPRFRLDVPVPTVADKNLTVIARTDDATFGILHSRFHELLVTALGSPYGNHPRYTPTTCFETFPFPDHLTPRDTAQAAPTGPLAERIAQAAQRLNELRENWLNPAEWVDWVITPEEEKAGFPEAPGRQARSRSRPEKAHPDQPLQRASRLARAGASGTRPGRRRCLWLERLQPGDARRGNPAPAPGAEPGTIVRSLSRPRY